MTTRLQGLAWLCSAAAVSGCTVGACLAGRTLNHAYAEDVLWIVAEYRAFPAWATLAVLNLATWLWLARVAFRTGTRPRRLALHALLALALTFPLGLELGMGIYYQQVTGELRIGEFLLARTELDLPSTPDGVCVHADLSDPWTWTLNEHRIHPKLLPLPLDDAALKARLLRPGDCVR